MIPPDKTAEAQVLGITLASPDHARDRFLSLGPDAWQHPAHSLVAAVITERLHRGDPIDAALIGTDVARRTGTDEAANQAGVRVFELYQYAPPLASLHYWADRVERIARASRAHDASLRFKQLIEHAVDSDNEQAWDRAVSEMTIALEDASTPTTGTEQLPMSMAELAETPDEHDWLVPGLLERTDRLILTGGEGLGKSELICQFALCVAAGLHPFSGRPVNGGTPVPTLVVDAENAQRQVARRYRRVRTKVDKLRADAGLEPVDWHKALHFVLRPEGIPLSSPRELARLEREIAAVTPDMVVAGPIYKLADEDTRDEQAAKALTVTLDRLRTRYQFTLLLEAHSGHGNGNGPRSVRPTGSSVFLRWPEFGYGLRAHEDYAEEAAPELVRIVSWRGPREDRNWPVMLGRNGRKLPWDAAADTRYDDSDYPD